MSAERLEPVKPEAETTEPAGERYEPIRIVRLVPKSRELLIAGAGDGRTKASEQVICFELSKQPSDSWLNGLAFHWRKEYGDGRPCIRQGQLEFPLYFAGEREGLQGYLNRVKAAVELTNARYEAIWCQEMREKREAEAQRRNREQAMQELLDRLEV